MNEMLLYIPAFAAAALALIAFIWSKHMQHDLEEHLKAKKAAESAKEPEFEFNLKLPSPRKERAEVTLI
jgi:hypothetical protein